MPTTSYTPTVGETVFVSLSGHQPILITVTGFQYHTYLKEDVMTFSRGDGSANWSTFLDQTFFPEIPTDTPYLYVVVCQVFGEGYTYSGAEDLAWFFTPQEAFAHITTLDTDECEETIVEVRPVT